MLPPSTEYQDRLRQVAGYLNFSSGARDPITLQNLNVLHAAASSGAVIPGKPPWFDVAQWLNETLEACEGTGAAFADVTQARRAVHITFSLLPPAYLDFHRDLLFHQEPELLFNGFFLGRCTEVVLGLLGQSDDDTEVVAAAIAKLNDFVGHRPVPQLTNRSGQPYPHEWVAPIPVYDAEAGFADGLYRRIFEQAMQILLETPEDLRFAAHFSTERLRELAIDPRAYDFDHPVNRRPNYQFGQWDPHAIDDEGYYDRFVVQQVTLDALLSRLEDADVDVPRDELYFEAAAVLAGTMLQAAAVSGWGPGAYSSDVTLRSLIGPIARVRDAFYEDLLARVQGPHGDRLREEQRLRQQPFGAARQHLNAALATQRAGQQQHAHLARLYARMGYTEAAREEADFVNAPSARIMCRIDCLLMQGFASLRGGDLAAAAEMPTIIVGLIQRGIQCGAFVDPWAILGFAGNFTRFQCADSVVHDHRVDELIQLTDYVFGFLARVWSEAAARDDEERYKQLELTYRETAEWWRQYSAHTIEDLQATDPLESYESAQLVARGLRVWHRGGASVGDVSFWAKHASLFDSPRAYALVIDALLQRGDFVASRALLIHWLANSEKVGFRRGNSAWSTIAQRWMDQLRRVARHEEPAELAQSPTRVDRPTDSIWSLAQRFFDQVEANAEAYWNPPTFSMGSQPPRRDWDQELADLENDLTGDPETRDEENEEDLFAAAYEDVTFRDSTDDGMEGSVFDPSQWEDDNQDSLEAESRRVGDHLDFHVALARMWMMAADLGEATAREAARGDEDVFSQRHASLAQWAQQAAVNRVGLLELLDSVRSFNVRMSGIGQSAMTRYDRQRVVRDALLERIISTAVETSDARRLLVGVLLAEQAPASPAGGASAKAAEAPSPGSSPSPPGSTSDAELLEGMGEDDQQAVRLYAALIAEDAARVREVFPEMLRAVRTKNLLYIPLARGGDPVKVFVARLRQRVLIHLLRWLPRCGLVFESCQLLEAARMMEQQNPIGPGAVTEFDGLFRIGFRSLVQAATFSARQWPTETRQQRSEKLISVLETLTETLLASWLTHSRSLRLSTLEIVADNDRWQQLVEFVKRYGEPLFCQTSLHLGNVRAILHQGVDRWLQQLQEEPEGLEDSRLLAELGDTLDPKDAQRHLTIVFEAILEHHAEYLDYSSTTTQSDRGELLYMFLDFLRLRVRYDRVAWNLRPVMWAHEILIRDGFETAAARWQQSLAERIGAEANIYVGKLRELQQRYSMRMPSVADRILERFTQPLMIDRMRALVEPAIRDAREGKESSVFRLLQKEANTLTEHPAGAGLDLPDWLEALEEEAESVINRQEGYVINPETLITVNPTALTIEQLEQQLNSAQRQGRRLPYMR